MLSQLVMSHVDEVFSIQRRYTMVGKCEKKKQLYEADLLNWNYGDAVMILGYGVMENGIHM